MPLTWIHKSDEFACAMATPFLMLNRWSATPTEALAKTRARGFQSAQEHGVVFGLLTIIDDSRGAHGFPDADYVRTSREQMASVGALDSFVATVIPSSSLMSSLVRTFMRGQGMRVRRANLHAHTTKELADAQQWLYRSLRPFGGPMPSELSATTREFLEG